MMNNKKGRGRPSSYEAYVRDYNKIASEMAEKGYTMAETKYTKAEWERAHRAEINDRNRAIKEGKRKTIGNVNRDLVKEQQWQFTSAQAKVQREIYKQKNPEIKEYVKLSDIRGGKLQAIDWNALSKREKELQNKGLEWGQIHSTISEEFFGS